ncbi:hypothetical protein B0H14DRAFT_2626066 [Mycena olivaceomarginata]|nr:hypothetical protein B0H14DRAFT_2626066 [Mycena olivaceomarginata]
MPYVVRLHNLHPLTSSRFSFLSFPFTRPALWLHEFHNRKGPPRGPPEGMNEGNNPECIVYLAYVLTALTQEEDRIRTIAGYLLKNNASLVVNVSPEVGAYVKAAVLHAFTDESIMIRNTLEPRNYLRQLMSTLDSTELSRQEARVRNSIPSTHPKFAIQYRERRRLGVLHWQIEFANMLGGIRGRNHGIN